MYIKRIQINSFGCLSCKEYNFDKGFNLIYGHNESGKSTLFAFVVFMFYGTKIKKEPGGISFKDKYMPWNGSPMQGTITLFYNGLTYELSRTVSSTQNSFSVFCIDTGQQIKDREILSAPGEYFLDAGVQTFYNTAYIAETRADYMSTDEIITKLTGLQNSDNGEVSYIEILDIIDNEIADLSSEKRRYAKIPVLTEKILKKREKLNELSEICENQNSLASEVECLKKKITLAEEEIKMLKQNTNKASVDETKSKKSTKRSIFLYASLLIPVATTLLFSLANPIITMCFFVLAFLGILMLNLHLKTSPAKEYDTKLFTLQQNNDKILELTEMLSDMRLEHERKSDMISAQADTRYSQDLLTKEIENLENEVTFLKTRLEAYQLARLAITNAYNEYKNEFAPKLSEFSANILKKITDNKYSGAIVSDNLKVNLESEYGYKPADSFSRGSVQLVEFSKKLALSEIVFGNNVPLFFDDAFAFFDEKRLAKAFEYIVELSKNTQILFSTCRKNELDILSQKDVNVLFF